MRKNKKKKYKKIIIMSALILIISISIIISRIYKYKIENKEYTTLRENKITDYINEEVAIDKFQSTVDFNKMYEINNDYIGWITIPGTNIDYPIVQTNNDTYYLKKSFNKKNSNSGCIFLSCVNSNNFDDKNTIIYGHNMRNNTMFSELENYEQSEQFFNENSEIWIFTKDYTYKYIIFAVRIVEENDEVFHSDINDVDTFVNYIKEKSKYAKEVNLQNPKVLTLSTCTNNKKNQRIVINATLQNEYKNIEN